MHVFQPGAIGGVFDGEPDDFIVNVVIRGMPDAAGEQPLGGFAAQRVPVRAQFLEQRGAQHDVAVLASFAALNVNDHSLAVDVADLEPRQFRATHTCGIEREQDCSIEEIASAVDQCAYLFSGQHGRQLKRSFRVWSFGDHPRPLECRHEQEP